MVKGIVNKSVPIRVTESIINIKFEFLFKFYSDFIINNHSNSIVAGGLSVKS